MRLMTLLLSAYSLYAVGAQSPSLSVVQFELGKEFVVPQCSSKKYSRVEIYDLQPQRPCWKHLSAGPSPGTPAPDSFRGFLQLPRSSVPQPLQADNVGFVVVNGKLEGLKFPTSGYRVKERALELLTSKYGPGDVKHTTMQNSMGAGFDGLSAIWTFDDLQVTFFGILNRVDLGVVQMTTPAGQSFEAQESAAKKAAEPQL